jgi:serine/threonine protein kinase
MNKPFRSQTIGPYEILAKLGHGGMGTVFRARHTTSGEVVAVKIASQHVAQHPTLRTRFRTEYLVASRVLHANLVRAIDYGEEDATPYLVMELVGGQGLDQRLKNKGPLLEAEAVALFSQVAQALQFLHQNMIVHRDIKPGNILLTDTGVAKLGDFGLGKDLESESVLTRSNMGLGTLQYAAPEQCDDAKNVDLRCDLYSLGVTMYVALTARYPFGSGNMYHMLQKKLANQYIPLKQVLPDVNPRLDQLLARSLNADPRLRPADCGEFLSALEGKPLSSIAAPSAAIAPPLEKRAVVRFATVLQSSCSSLTGSPASWEAKVLDVSANGLCLQMQRRFEPRTSLQCTLSLGAEESLHTLLVQTRWVKQFAERAWLIGCAFLTPLTPEELDRMLISGAEQTRADGPTQ